MSGSGSKSPPPPSKTADCKTSKDGTTTSCPLKDKNIKLVELVEMYKHGAKWKQRPVDARKQFINLDDKVDAAKEHPEFGRAIWLKARVEWVSGDKKRSLSGKKIYWYSKASKANKKGLAKAEKDSLKSAGAATKKHSADTDKDGWTPRVPFYPSAYGGDKFDVFATLSKGYKGGLKAGSYEVWRKFWYQISEMKDRAGTARYTVPGGVTTTIEAGYRKAKIEFKEKGPRGKIPHTGNTPTSSMDKLGKKHFVVDDLVPFKCHLMTCDYGGMKPENKPVKDKLKSKTWTSPIEYVLWPHGPGKPWMVEAKYKAGASWKDIPDAKLSTSKDPNRPGYQKVKIDFSGGPVTPSAKSPTDIKLKLKTSGPKYLGWGGGRAHILLCTGLLRDIRQPADHVPVQRSDAVHEIGHALGLVQMSPTKAGAHKAWHNGKHHCKQPSKKCAMYTYSSTTRATTFHSIGGKGCNEHLRTQDFDRGTMKPLWK